MGDAVLLGDLGSGVLVAAHERGDLDVIDALERVEMFLAERALAGDTNFHQLSLAGDAVSGYAGGGLLGPAGGLALGSGLAPVLQNDVADRGVRGRHGVEAVDL